MLFSSRFETLTWEVFRLSLDRYTSGRVCSHIANLVSSTNLGLAWVQTLPIGTGLFVRTIVVASASDS